MRPTFGVCWACLALTGLAACSSAAPPPPEGNATLNFLRGGFGHKEIFGPGGTPDSSKFGGTVLDGTNGVKVICSVKGHSVQGHIESPEMSLDVSSNDAAANAQMTFYTAGQTGTQNAVVSVDSASNVAATCTLTVSGGIYVVKSGSIFAHYSCPTVRDPAQLSIDYATDGYFLFTGCSQ